MTLPMVVSHSRLGNGIPMFNLNNLLSIVYLKQDTESIEWENVFLGCFKDSLIKPIKHKGIKGDIQQARINAIKTVETKYYVMLDYDDLVVPDVIFDCVNFLENNPEYIACTVNEGLTGLHGRLKAPAMLRKSINHPNVFRNPREVHTCTVFRTDIVKDLLPLFSVHKFFNFDWALRMLIADKGMIGIVPKVGYYYRLHSIGHSTIKECDGFVPSKMTYHYLRDNRLINTIV